MPFHTQSKGNVVVVEFLGYLRRNTELEINLSGKDIGKNGAMSLIEHLRYSERKVHSINLSNNRIDSEGMVQILEHAAHIKNLHTINLSGNDPSDREQAERCFEALEQLIIKNKSIRNIDISGTKLLFDRFSLGFIDMHNIPKTLIAAIKESPSLETFTISTHNKTIDLCFCRAKPTTALTNATQEQSIKNHSLEFFK